MKTKKFTLRGYLFSILALFLCMNVAQAVLVDQMYKCTVPSADNEINYKITWMAHNSHVYSTFGIANSHPEDSSGYLLSLSMQSSDFRNHWNITRNNGCCGKKTWNIQLTAEGKSIIDAKNINCKLIMFDQSLATRTERFYNTATSDYSLKYMVDGNPIKLVDTNLTQLDITEDDDCSEEISEKTGLVTKRRCCSKGMCNIL